MASKKRILIACLAASLAAILIGVIITVAVAALTSVQTIPSDGTIQPAAVIVKRVLTRT